MDDTISFYCECCSPMDECMERIEFTTDEAIHARASGYIISNKCKHGPEPTDRLVERHETYSIYEETA